MADYIRRILAKAQFTGNFQSEYPTALIHALLDDVPSEDVRPVVRGKWKRIEDDFGKYDRCSNCGKEYSFGPIVTMHFCPNCGAMMEES